MICMPVMQWGVNLKPIGMFIFMSIECTFYASHICVLNYLKKGQKNTYKMKIKTCIDLNDFSILQNPNLIFITGCL